MGIEPGTQKKETMRFIYSVTEPSWLTIRHKYIQLFELWITEGLDGIDQSSNLSEDPRGGKYSPRQEYPVDISSYKTDDSPCDADTLSIRWTNPFFQLLFFICFAYVMVKL